MVKAQWVDNTLVVIELTTKEYLDLPQWVRDSVTVGVIAVHSGVAYSSDEQTAREKLEF